MGHTHDVSMLVNQRIFALQVDVDIIMADGESVYEVRSWFEIR